ncbi:hypothetical protein GCM10009660_28610 [Catellatospora bangladeshensis]
MSADVVNLSRTAPTGPDATQSPLGAAASATMHTSQCVHNLGFRSVPPGQPTGACLKSGSSGPSPGGAPSAPAVIAATAAAWNFLITRAP